MQYGCIGEKLGHSFSQEIHARLGLYEYQLCPVAKEDFHSFMTRHDFLGINVTIPYKKDVMEYLTHISQGARLCGAVNTVVCKDGILSGFNTDFLGMKKMLERAGIALSGKKVLILGSGGTSGTALALCQSEEVARVHRVSRSGKDGALTYEEAGRLTDTQVIINTTPCGMFPHAGHSPIDLELFPNLEAVADAVYNPLSSQLVLSARARGAKAIGGLYMLVAQAVYAARIFTGRDDLEEKIDEIYDDLFKEKRNLVLIGMPGSGKSTVGQALAEKVGKEFIDSDEEIVRTTGMPIPDIFRKKGEAGFRDVETDVIRSLSARQGLVLATGGGAILRKENIEALRSNGTLLFLDAPLCDLMPTSDRPLSSTREDLEKRYGERYEKYLSAADYTIPVTRNLEENLKAIEKEL